MIDVKPPMAAPINAASAEMADGLICINRRKRTFKAAPLAPREVSAIDGSFYCPLVHTGRHRAMTLPFHKLAYTALINPPLRGFCQRGPMSLVT